METCIKTRGLTLRYKPRVPCLDNQSKASSRKNLSFGARHGFSVVIRLLHYDVGGAVHEVIQQVSTDADVDLWQWIDGLGPLLEQPSCDVFAGGWACCMIARTPGRQAESPAMVH